MDLLVEQIEKWFLPDLERFASEMRQQFPVLKFKVWRGPAGVLTEYQGYDLGVECLFPRDSANVADNVALSVDLCQLTSTPRLMATVVWGHPSGHVEAAFQDNWQSNSQWPEATPETIEELRQSFPRLVRAFQLAVERGAPPTQERSR